MIRLTHTRLSCCLCLLWLLGAPAKATEVTGLYEAVVPVSGQSAPERNGAVAEGLAQVLVKLVGQRTVLADPAVKAALGKSGTFLVSYMYEAPVARMHGQSGDPSMATLRLRLRYEPRAVQALLERAKAPLWGPDRPSLFLRVEGRGPGGPHSYGPESAQGATLIDAAGQRGLPVIITASAEREPADVRDLVGPAVIQAARESGARFVLGGSATRTAAGRWQASGVLVETTDSSRADRFEVSGPDEYQTLRELVSTAADRLGARHAAAPASATLQEARLRVAGIPDLALHGQVQRALGNLPLVREVQTLRVAAGVAEYRLVVASEPAGIRRMLEGLSLLARIVPAEPDRGIPVFDAGLADAR